ncbi:MAG: hypothetical protein HC880_01750 [Bacteroidia bacterium]|nr:hypothetical protein [Bacteroidia bacterium]
MRNFLTSFLVLFLVIQTVSAQDPILNSIIKTVSPVEVSAMIKTLGIEYDKTLLNNPSSRYQSDFKKALNLGVYSTDLGYANINDQKQDALTYINSLKQVADELSLGNFIDVGKILSLAINKNDLNKLLEETSLTFENMSEHLQKQNQANLAALILTGGWLESLYITCEVAKKRPDVKELADRIVEQKLVLNQLLPVLGQFQSDQGIFNLVADLQKLSGLFSRYNFGTGGDVSTTKETIGGVEVIVVQDNAVSPDICGNTRRIEQYIFPGGRNQK